MTSQALNILYKVAAKIQAKLGSAEMLYQKKINNILEEFLPEVLMPEVNDHIDQSIDMTKVKSALVEFFVAQDHGKSAAESYQTLVESEQLNESETKVFSGLLEASGERVSTKESWFEKLLAKSRSTGK